MSGTRETRGRCYNHRKETATHLESNVWVPVLVLTLNHYMTMATGLSSLGNGASQVVLVVKRLPANAGDGRDAASIPGSGRSPGGGHGNPLQCPCLGNPHGQRSLGGYSPRGGRESDTTECLSTLMGPGPHCSWLSCKDPCCFEGGGEILPKIICSCLGKLSKQPSVFQRHVSVSLPFLQ